MNMRNSTIVLEEVEKIYEAIRLADELAGEAKTKSTTTADSLKTSS